MREQDRKILIDVCDAAYKARKPISYLGIPLEPTWSMGFGLGTALASCEVFLPNDSEDAIARGWKKIQNRATPEELTLYLSIEPNSEYGRMPPLTETIRQTGVRRVVIGSLNPYSRMHGKGIATLKGYGIDVIIADGEEARKCQLLYEDYAKVMNRHLPQWHLLTKLDCRENRFQANILSAKEKLFTHYDGMLVDIESLFKGDLECKEGQWLIVLDAEAALPFDHRAVKKNIERMLVFIGKEASEKQSVFTKKGIRTELAIEKSGALDLAFVLRKLRDLGFFSIYSVEGAKLWKEAIHSGLVDMLGSFVGQNYDSQESGKILSSIEKEAIDFFIDPDKTKESRSYQLRQTKLLQKSQNNFWLGSLIQEVE